jgi:hypothetical protein
LVLVRTWTQDYRKTRKKEDMTQYPPLVYFFAFIIARNSFVFDFFGAKY